MLSIEVNSADIAFFSEEFDSADLKMFAEYLLAKQYADDKKRADDNKEKEK